MLSTGNYLNCFNFVAIFIGIAIPNRSDTGQNDVKKPVRYGKKKPKQVKEKSEVIEAEQDSVVGKYMKLQLFKKKRFFFAGPC